MVWVAQHGDIEERFLGKISLPPSQSNFMASIGKTTLEKGEIFDGLVLLPNRLSVLWIICSQLCGQFPADFPKGKKFSSNQWWGDDFGS